MNFLMMSATGFY